MPQPKLISTLIDVDYEDQTRVRLAEREQAGGDDYVFCLLVGDHEVMWTSSIPGEAPVAVPEGLAEVGFLTAEQAEALLNEFLGSIERGFNILAGAPA